MIRERIFAFLLLCASGLSSILYAQDYPTGLARYLQKDFARAESVFQQVATHAPSNAERAQALKMLGLSQYMQGKRSESAESIKLAKRLVPSLSLAPREVLDDSVIDFYNSIEAPAIVEPVAPPVVVKEVKPKKVQAPPPVKKIEKATELLVLSNALEAKVMVDGYFRGRVGDLIAVDPGEHSIEVYAANYHNFTQSVYLKKSTITKVRAQLEKLVVEKKPEEPKPTPPPAPIPKAPEKKLAVKKKKVHKPLPPMPEPHSWTDFMPFGIPQFAQRKTGLGLGLGIAQVAGVGFFTARWLQANKLSDQTTSTISDRTAQEESITDATQRQAFADETDAYYADQMKSINGLRTQAYIGIGIFVASWIGSSLEAWLNPPLMHAPVVSPTGEILRHQNSFERWTLEPAFIPANRYAQDTFALRLRFYF